MQGLYIAVQLPWYWKHFVQYDHSHTRRHDLAMQMLKPIHVLKLLVDDWRQQKNAEVDFLPKNVLKDKVKPLKFSNIIQYLELNLC